MNFERLGVALGFVLTAATLAVATLTFLHVTRPLTPAVVVKEVMVSPSPEPTISATPSAKIKPVVKPQPVR